MELVEQIKNDIKSNNKKINSYLILRVRVK